MRLRPKQQPHPPLWYMRNPETAARGGMNAIVVGSLDTLEANVIRYRRLWEHEQGAGALTRQGSVPKIGLVVHVLIAASDAEAIEAATPAWEAYRWNLGTPRRLEAERRQLTQFLGRADSGDGPPSQPERHRAVEERRDLDHALEELSAEEREARSRRRRLPGEIAGGVIAGSPDSVRVFMEEYADTGANYIVCSFQWGSLSHAQAMRSIELWATEIMPRYRPGVTNALA
jgi:alkanesulfonate monooxygenase SsuD/methylene tetrahydromethanopterin reductase-like flavin-dependent oxidoreductase (luciferase family)